MIAALRPRKADGIFRNISGRIHPERRRSGRGAMSGLPDDDLRRSLAVARPDDPDLLHLAVVGDTYTVLLSGEQTAGRFALIDMLIPVGGGPPPHRHDFEECFHVLEGSVEVTLRDDPPVRLGPGRRSTSRPTRRTRSATPPTSPRGCCARPSPPGSRRSSPSSATASTRAPRRRPPSARKSGRRGCGARSSGRRTTAWSCCRRPAERACGGGAPPSGAASRACGRAPAPAGRRGP